MKASQSGPPAVGALSWRHRGRAVTRAVGARACPRPAALSCGPEPGSAASRFPRAS